MEFFEKDFGKILKHNALEQRRAFNKTDSNCGRVYDRNLVQVPVTVDLYANYARITDYSEDELSDEMAGMVSDICRRMLYIEGDKVILQRRPRRVGREQHEKQDSEPLYVDVRENGMTFKVDLKSHVDTGLFLDQANNRKMIMEQSFGRDVLNLFSYTGSFSVYAAKGGAKSVTSVDMSNTYTAWAEDNLKSNGFAGEMYRCVCQDARVFVAEAIKKKDKYDIIIFDPPCFSNSRKMDYDFDVQRDYVRWLTGLCSIMRKGGFILFSTNLATFGFDGSLKRRNKVKEITAQTKAQGFTCRVGSARSWILEKDDEKLALDWDDSAAEKPVKKSTRKKAQSKVAAAKEKKEPIEADAAENKEAENKEAENKETEKIIQTEPVEHKESDVAESAIAEVSEAAYEAAPLGNEAPPEDKAAVSEEDAETPEDEAELTDDSEELPEVEEPVLDDSYLTDDEGIDDEVSDESVEEASEDSGFGMNEWKEGDEDSKHSHRDSRERKDRRDSFRDRPARPAHRDGDDRDRGFGRRDSFRDRSGRASYRDRDDRDRGFGRQDSFRDRSGRPSYRDRDDRDRSFGRRDSFRDRFERPSFRDRDDRDRGFGRDDSFRDRDRRSSRFGDRDDSDRNRDRVYDRRGSYGDRFDESPFGSRFSRSSYRYRDDRGGYGAWRDDERRDSYRDRFDRPSFRDRSDRPSYRSRDERHDRDRGSFRKDSRKPYGFDSFKPARDRNDSKQFFWLDDEDDKKDK
ncbi:MAG: class I SAM-dependent methyltransferase [Sphaerochaetaceae bacterium]